MFPSSCLIELTCLNVAIYYLRNEKEHYWNSFIPYMLFTAIAELTGWGMIMILQEESNNWFYNIILVVEVLFYTWVFYGLFKHYFNSNPWVIAWLTIFAGSFAAESVLNKFYEFNSNTLILVEIIFVIASGCYYYQLLKKDEYVNLNTHPQFWIVNGIFLFFFGSTGIHALSKELMKYTIAGNIPVNAIVYPVLNLILYGCWAYAFSCRYYQKTSSS